MPLHPPHLFDSLVGRVCAVSPILLVGSGMSYDLVPQVNRLSHSIKSKQDEIEQALGIDACAAIDLSVDGELYRWAEDAYKKLLVLGFPEHEAKLRIAKVLGVTTDPCWSAKANMPIRGTTPRHRVVARFAREGRWHALWSLNWDVWLERALESVGVEAIQERSSSPAVLPNTWVCWFDTWVPPHPINQGTPQTVFIFKPHGCVNSLLRGEGVFILTAAELAGKMAGVEETIGNRLRTSFTDHSLIVAGWSASEEYLRNGFSKLKGSLNVSSTLTIIDPKFNDFGHEALVEAYGTTKAAAACCPQYEGFPNTDDTFLWIQTRHGLSCMLALASAHEAVVINEYLDAYREPQQRTSPDGFVMEWFDSFLPVWSRLCFNNGRQKFYAGVEVATDVLPTHRRDEHVPWSDQGLPRLDLIAAKSLLIAMSRKKLSCGHLDYDLFPGAIWDPRSGHLVIPVPTWNPTDAQSLSALKPLVESRHWANQGKIKKVSILGVDHETPARVVGASTRSNWAYEVSRLMHYAGFANPLNIGWLSLDEWEASL
jgi:hypothetical protein